MRRDIGWSAPLISGGLSGLVEEQAALRRVATLVARGIPAGQLFAAVTEEVGRVLSAKYVHLIRYEPDDTGTALAAFGGTGILQVGSSLQLGGNNVTTLVFETGRSARIDDYHDASGPFAVGAREQLVPSSVGAPIIVEASLWGVMVASCSEEQPLPADTEPRLASFTELVATAVANAESRAGLARLAEEQEALRRIATLVARGVSPEQVFAAVTEEVARLLGAEMSTMVRYEPDDAFTIVGSIGSLRKQWSVGSRWPLGGNNTTTLVFETARPARIETFGKATGEHVERVHDVGLRSAVAVPIIVEGRLWGVIGIATTRAEPLPADTEARLTSFTELVATAIANAESRAGLAQLAEEQKALRRIATLVARGVPPEAVFASVTDELARLLLAEMANLIRFESDGTFTMLASARERFPVGGRWPIGGKNPTTTIFETGRPARSDDYAANATGPQVGIAREAGLRSTVGVPIIVEGRLWGAIGVGSNREATLPPDTEARLGSFMELVAMAIANAESRAALATSRARIVAAADESRRKIERDLHDGAQARQVHAVIALKLALRALSNADANAEELVAEALRHAEQANAELRELAHGILPAALTRGGLRVGLDALVSRLSLPVSVHAPVERLPAGVEATAYFVVSEALTNVVKHARAAGAEVTARVESGTLVVEVCDDGVGGARGDHGTGLGGLEDRVSALDGRLVVESPPGGGTRVCASLPIPDQG
jgi:GAF domain-containing protein